jgi:MOSC domain-containing protein YiiM
MTGRVVAILTTAEGGGVLQPVEQATLESGRGMVGDRYYDHRGTFSENLKASADWEITLIELEEINRFNATRSVPLPHGSFRRNIVTERVRLNDLVGRQFDVGGSVLEGVRLCEPCAYLAKLVGPDVVKAMAHRAGLRARIISGSIIRSGDKVGVHGAA